MLAGSPSFPPSSVPEAVTAADARSDYLRIAASGLKRLDAASITDEDREALARLVAQQLATVEGAALVLQRPEYASRQFNPEQLAELLLAHERWLLAGSDEPGDAILFGEIGYWQHWWNMLHDPSVSEAGRLLMDLIVPLDDAFASRRWHQEIDREIRNHVFTRGLVRGRVIVPPQTPGSPAEPLVEMALDQQFEVRVLAAPGSLALYNGVAAVLPEATANDPRPAHRLTRTPSIVRALRDYFELCWASAVPWSLATGECRDIVRLLGLGWTDQQIADALEVSARTVSRRVSDLMRSLGVSSRFALGARLSRTIGASASHEPR